MTKLPLTFQWVEFLWLLAALPLLIALYLWLQRRKRKAAMQFANLALMAPAGGVGTKLRRAIPPTLFLLALVAMIGAMSRPAAVVTLPVQNQTVILAMDVSGSMRATDVDPNRLAAAQAAAKAFVNEQPKSTKIGIVSFAGTAAVAQAPTTNRDDVIAAIDRFQLQRGTAIGSSIVLSLATLFPNAGIDLGELQFGGGRDAALKGTPFAQRFAEKKEEVKPVPPGSFESAAIVLLSDGHNTAGPDPMKAAKMAAERGVKVYTVGIGTPKGTTLQFEGWSFRVRLDEESLKQIANTTRGEYLFAGNAADLKKIYQSLNTKFAFEKRETEITALFAAAAALLATLSGLLSLLWFNRIF